MVIGPGLLSFRWPFQIPLNIFSSLYNEGSLDSDKSGRRYRLNNPKRVQSAPTTIGIRRRDEPDQSLVTLGDSAIIEQVGSCSFSPWHNANITLDGGGINAGPWRLQMDIDCLSSVEVFIVSYQTMKLRNLTSGV